MTYLNTLLAEAAAITDEEIAARWPTDEVGRNEKVLGTASRETQALFALWDKGLDEHREGTAAFHARQFDSRQEAETEAGRLHTLSKKLKTLRFLFWESVALEFETPADASGRSVRKDGIIVATYHSADDEPMMIMVNMGPFSAGIRGGAPGQSLFDFLFSGGRRN